MWNQNGWPRPPAIDGNKSFDNDDQATKHYCCLPQLTGNSNVLWPGHHYQKFYFHQQQEALAAHILISHFLSMAFFRFFATTFLYQGVLIGISFSFLLLSFLAKILLCNSANGLLTNVAVDYFKLISRHGNTALMHVLSYCTYLL